MRCPMNSDESKDALPNGTGVQRNLNDEDVDFSEYVWMGEENLEEFDRKVELELWEEQYIESCFREMWREEEQDTVYFNVPQNHGAQAIPTTYNSYYPRQQPNHLYQRQPTGAPAPSQDAQLSTMMGGLTVAERNDLNQSRNATSTKLNPEAAVFVPRGLTAAPATSTANNVDR